VTPVRRQDDYGVDLYCTLTERVGQRERVWEYFAVQSEEHGGAVAVQIVNQGLNVASGQKPGCYIYAGLEEVEKMIADCPLIKKFVAGGE
jgi:hypothetical protein